MTVNDVLLAGVAGGLREWLAAPAARRCRGCGPRCPVSLHHRDESADELGNRDSFLNVDLPLAEPDPLAPARPDQRRDREAQAARRRRGALRLLPRAGAVQATSARAAQRLAGGPREFSLSISNVPGPRAAVSVAGRPVERLCSVAEPADRHALRVSAISCAGALGVGLCTDPDALPGVAGLAIAIDARVRRASRAAERGSVSASAAAMALQLGLNLGYWGIGPQGDEAVEIGPRRRARRVRLGLGR